MEDMGQTWHSEKTTQLEAGEGGGTEWWGWSRGGQFSRLKGEVSRTLRLGVSHCKKTWVGVSPRPSLSRTEGERSIAKSDLNF